MLVGRTELGRAEPPVLQTAGVSPLRRTGLNASGFIQNASPLGTDLQMSQDTLGAGYGGSPDPCWVPGEVFPALPGVSCRLLMP